MSNILIPELKALVDADQLPVFALVRNLRFVPDPFALHTLVEGEVLGIDRRPESFYDLIPDGDFFDSCFEGSNDPLLAVDSRTGDKEYYFRDWWLEGESYTTLLLVGTDGVRLAHFVWEQVRGDARFVRDILSSEDRDDLLSLVERHYLKDMVIVDDGQERSDLVYCSVWEAAFAELRRLALKLRSSGDDSAVEVPAVPRLGWKSQPGTISARPPRPRLPWKFAQSFEPKRAFISRIGYPEVDVFVPGTGAPIRYPSVAPVEMLRALLQRELPRCFLVRNIEYSEADGWHVKGIVAGEVVAEAETPWLIRQAALTRIQAWYYSYPENDASLGVDESGAIYSAVTLIPADVERVAAWIWDQMNVIDPGLRQTVRAWRNQQGEIQVDFPWWADNLWFDGLVVATTEPVPVPPQTPEADGWIPRAPTIPALVRKLVLQWARERMFGG